MQRIRKTTYRCTDCRFSFVKTHKFSIEKYPHGTDLPLPKKDPDCPKCNKDRKVNLKSSVTDKTHNLDENSRIQEMIASKTAPSVGGASNFTKAIDATAEIVMQDYGMTDINMSTSLREGDSCVPKLNHELEAKVDKVFAPQANRVMPGGSQLNSALMKQINAGAFKNQSDVVKRNEESGVRVPTRILHEYRPEKKPH